ncbi:MAG TPA: 3'(2'),5'-bisphosphate nucleotidase [Rhodothermales bacterium]
MIPYKNYRREAEVALEAAAQAARLCEAVRSDLAASTLEKNDRSPVTIADFGSQALVCRAVHEAFPDDAIIAEEDALALRSGENQTLLARLTGYVRAIREGANESLVFDWIDFGTSDSASGRFWTLDPIDGTKGFLRNDQYAVALALIEDGSIRVAVLGCPRLPRMGANGTGAVGTLMVAVAGEGAYETGIDGRGDLVPIRVSSVTEPRDLRFCESVESAHSSHSDAARIADHLGIQAPPKRLDSQAKYGLVARGDAEIYLRMPKGGDYQEKIWDHAAGALVVAEAGGRASDLRGKPLDFTHGRTLARNYGILVTNGTLHDELLRAVAELDMAGAGQ